MEKTFTVIDIIIVNYNSTDYLLKCLGSVYESLESISANVFVQDNGSKDGVDRISDLFPKVTLVKNGRNIGFASAVNKVLRQCSAQYVVLLNPDAFILKGFFGSILQYLKDNPDIGILGPKILDDDGKIQGSARSFPTPLTAFFGRKSLITKLFPNNPFTRSNVLTTLSDGKTPMEVDWVSGACMVINKNAIDKVGLLDERFFIYWEDADWCRRMWEAGLKVVYFPQSCVIHHVGISSDQLFLRSLFEFHKSVYHLFEKYNKPSFQIIRFLVINGLFLRFCFVVASSGVAIWIKKYQTFGKPETNRILRPIKKRIKIMRMIARLNIGGPAIHVFLLSRGLDTKKFESTLITGIISPQEGDMSYLFDSVDMTPTVIPELQREISVWMDLKTIGKMFRALLHEKPDIVHTHTAKAGTSARLAALLYNLINKKNVRVVHTFHGHIFEGYFSKGISLFFIWIERLLATMTDVVIVISETQKIDLVKKYHIAPADKIQTIELGFDLKPFLTCSSLKGRFKTDLGVKNDTVLIGIIGRLVPIKHHIMFFKAAKAYLQMNPELDTKFVVVGDGELREELRSYCQTQGLLAHVVFCGWLKDISYVYADLSILALTSLNEGTPVSIIEAMAASVPVVATNAGGVKDLVGSRNDFLSSNGFMVCERGILCIKNDSIGFAKGMKYLLQSPAHEKQERLKQARSFVEQRYSQQRLLNDIESLYTELMNDTMSR